MWGPHPGALQESWGGASVISKACLIAELLSPDPSWHINDHRQYARQSPMEPLRRKVLGSKAPPPCADMQVRRGKLGSQGHEHVHASAVLCMRTSRDTHGHRCTEAPTCLHTGAQPLLPGGVVQGASQSRMKGLRLELRWEFATILGASDTE